MGFLVGFWGLSVRMLGLFLFCLFWDLGLVYG